MGTERYDNNGDDKVSFIEKNINMLNKFHSNDKHVINERAQILLALLSYKYLGCEFESEEEVEILERVKCLIYGLKHPQESIRCNY